MEYDSDIKGYRDEGWSLLFQAHDMCMRSFILENWGLVLYVCSPAGMLPVIGC